MSDKYCILQDDAKDCGVCSLLSIIKYYSGNVSKEYLRELTKTDHNGVNAFNLLQGARVLGFEAYGIKGKIKDLNISLLPVIAHVVIDQKYPHFIVIYKIDKTKNKILVMDPAKGFTFYTIDNFTKITSNYYLILKPKYLLPKFDDTKNYLDKIRVIIMEYKTIFVSVIGMSLVYTIASIIGTYHFKILYEADSNFNILFLILIFLMIIKYIINYCRNYLLILFNTILDKYLVKDAFHHIINLPYLYYRNHTNGDLLTRINDLGQIKELLGNLFVGLLVDLVLAIVIFIFMLNISIKLTLLVICSLALYMAVVLINSRFIKSTIRSSYEKAAIVNNNLVESLASFETIKNLSIQNYVFRQFSNKYDDYINTNKHLFKKVQKEILFKDIALELGGLFVIYYGINLINMGSLSIISLITFISLSNYLTDPVRKLLDLHLTYQNTKESLRRIKEIYHIPKENLSGSNRFLKYLHGDIDISNVTYSYNGIDNVINNISLEIREGEKILIYGNSGCGKSTLMQLLIRYLNNNYKGSITIGGYDLKDIDIIALRKNICYVSQNEYLYTNSVYENITLGKKIKYSLFLDIVKNLAIDEIIANSSMGYNFIIENNGENISGGEKKRLIIARSVLQRANIYIYDETFSEMDIELERRILSYLFKTHPNKTFIVISHRFSNEDLFNRTIHLGGENNEAIK